jgi:membrane protease YdiL (CAAX protease family)
LKSVAAFIRTILPKDLSQLFLVFGSLLLYVSSQLRFWPAAWTLLTRNSRAINLWMVYRASDVTTGNWARIVWVCGILLQFAGSAGLFLCLWPGKRPTRNILLFVCSPAVWAIAVISIRFLLLARNPLVPVLENSYIGVHSIDWALSCLWQLGPGLRFALLGLLCVALFEYRLARGPTALPVALPEESILLPGDEMKWRRVWMFVWLTCTYDFVVYRLATVPFAVLYLFVLNPANLREWGWISYLEDWVASAALVFLAAWAVGSGAWREFRRFVRLPEPRFAGIAIAMAVVNWAFVPLIVFSYDRITWANAGFGMHAPPIIESYLSLPDWSAFLTILPAAFFEEVIYRGYLQPRFVGRYGLTRGLMILGVLWGAYHFHGDFGAGLSDSWILLGFLWRPALTVAHGFVFGWLTLRSDSILPAALLHGLYNVAVYTHLASHPSLWIFLRIISWAVLAYVLFRYWPPKTQEQQAQEVVPDLPEPA